MAERRRPALLLALAGALFLAAGALALAPGLAEALKAKGKRSASLAAKEDGGVRAKCPRRGPSTVISGGFLSESPLGASGAGFSVLAFFDSRPSGKRAWTVRAANFDGEPATVKAKALCSREDPRIETRTKKKRVAAAGRTSFRVSCRRGEAIAGGYRARRFAQDAGPEIVAYGSHRRGRKSWRIAAYNNSGTFGGAIEGYVRCAKRRPGLVTHREVGEAFDQAGVELKPACEEGEELWSGGFRGSYEGFDPFGVIVADRSHPRGQSWVSRFVGYQSSGEVTAFAYCRPL